MAPNDNVTPQMTDNNQNPTQAPLATTQPVPTAPDVQANPAAPSMPTSSQAPPSAQDIAKRALSSPVKAFAAGILQHLAGPPPEVYATDESGKTTAVPEHRTTGGAVRSLAANALAGLAAGSQVQTRKSGLGSALAGFGAGAGAVTKKLSDADQLARQQSSEEFEQEQRALVQKSNVAHLNANTMSSYFGAIKGGNDLNPVFAQNHALVDAINDSPELGHAFTLSSEEADQRRASDPHFVSDNVLLPLGRVPKLDQDGNPVLDAKTGQPLTTFQIAVIPGHDGKLVVPQSLVDDVKKYGDRAGIENADALNAGSEISLNKVIPLMSAVQAEKKAELAGWQKATDVLSEDGKTHKQMNPVTGEVREYPAKIQPNVKNEAGESAATIGEKNATASVAPSTITKNLAEAGKANTEKTGAAQVNAANAGAAGGLSGEAYLKTLPAGTASVVRAIAEGREVRSARQLQDKNGNPTPLAIQLHTAYPDYDDSKGGAAWTKVRNEYMGTGTTAKKVVSYNTSMEHMKDLYDSSTAEGLFNPLSSDYQKRQAAIGFVSNEVGNAIKNGTMTEAEGKQITAGLKGLTPEKTRERIQETAKLLHDKTDEYQTKFEAGAPSSAVKVPLLLSPKAAAAYDYVQSGGKQQQPQQPAQSTPPQKQPADPFFVN